MIGCGECGAFGKMLPLIEDCVVVVGGQRFVGKMNALRCKKCGSTWHDPEEDAEFQRAAKRVASGVDPERANDFDIRRAAR